MKPSTCIIAKHYDNGEVLLYHTLRTSMVLLKEADYEKVFLDNDYSDGELVQKLCFLGFITDDEEEVGAIERIRLRDALKGSQVITIFATNDCNARCSYCFEHGLPREAMSPSTADQIVAFIAGFCPDKTLQIQWFGGEPLMAMERIRQITLGLEAHGFALNARITTNGSLLTEDAMDFFKSHYGNIAFQITIDDIGEAYAKVKRYVDIRASDAFSRVIENCRLVIRSGVLLEIRINFMAEKFEAATKVFEHLETLFSDEDQSKLTIYMSPITPSEDCSNCDAFSLTPETAVALAKFYGVHGVTGFAPVDKKHALLQTYGLKPHPSPCGQARKRHVVITAQGKIYKCHRLVRYTGDEYIIGDVWHGIDEHSPHYLDFCDSRILDSDCRKCQMLPICQGGCFVIRKLYGKQLACDKFKKADELLDLYRHSFNVWNCSKNEKGKWLRQ